MIASQAGLLYAEVPNLALNHEGTVRQVERYRLAMSEFFLRYTMQHPWARLLVGWWPAHWREGQSWIWMVCRILSRCMWILIYPQHLFWKLTSRTIQVILNFWGAAPYIRRKATAVAKTASYHLTVHDGISACMYIHWYGRKLFKYLKSAENWSMSNTLSNYIWNRVELLQNASNRLLHHRLSSLEP